MNEFAEAFPESIELTGGGSILEIKWDDGHVGRHRLSVLRASCPCASCTGHHPSQSLNLTPAQFTDVRLLEIAPVGRYAYNIAFSDTHATGIYTLTFLRRLENSA